MLLSKTKFKANILIPYAKQNRKPLADYLGIFSQFYFPLTDSFWMNAVIRAYGKAKVPGRKDLNDQLQSNRYPEHIFQ